MDKTDSLSLQKDGTKNSKLSSISGNIYGVFNYDLIMLDPDEMEFSKFIASVDRLTSSFTNFKNQGIFFCGGEFPELDMISNSSKYFSLHTNKFYELKPMKYPRYFHGAVTLNDQIYVCGGYDNTCKITKSTEIFDPNLNSWRNGCNLNKDYESFGLCTLEGSIYATGYNCLERFDPRESRWTILFENDRQRRHYVAVGCNNFIYKFDEFGCNKFDIRQNKWINDAIKNVSRRIGLACAVDNEIYAVDSSCNLVHLNCENDSIIEKYKLKGKAGLDTILFV